MKLIKALSFIVAILMLFFVCPALAGYNDLDSTGHPLKIDPQYGQEVKIRIIYEKDIESVTYKDEGFLIETTYKDGTIVLVSKFDFTKEKRVTRVVGNTTIRENYRWQQKRNQGNTIEAWTLSYRTTIDQINNTTIENYWLLGSNNELRLTGSKVTSKNNSVTTIEYYNSYNYPDGKDPHRRDTMTETIIYPKGTTLDQSRDYFNDQGPGNIFPAFVYESIEQKLFETKSSEGEIIERRRVTKLLYNGREILRVEVDGGTMIWRCDNNIDYRKDVMDQRDGNYTTIDINGNGKADYKTKRKIITINLD